MISQALVVGSLAVLSQYASAKGFEIVEGTPVKVGQFNQSVLYNITTPGDRYFERPQILDLRGSSRYDIGYAAGVLIGKGILSNYNALLKTILGNSTLEPVEQDLFNDFIDWQWNDYLSKQTP